MLSSIACPAVQYFPTLSYKRHDLRKKFVEHEMCVSIFSSTFVLTVFHSRRNKRDIKSVHKSSCKVPVILFQILMKQGVSTDFRRILKNQISWKSVQWKPSCSMRTDGQTNPRTTDMTKLIVAFRSFANAPKNETVNISMRQNHYSFMYFLRYSLHFSMHMLTVEKVSFRYFDVFPKNNIK